MRQKDPSAEDFDAMILPSFEYLRKHGKREIALKLVALTVEFEKSLKPSEPLE